MGIGAWGNFLDRVTGWLPFQGRIERLKNEIKKLEQRKNYLIIHKRNDRIIELNRIELRLHKLREQLFNYTK